MATYYPCHGRPPLCHEHQAFIVPCFAMPKFSSQIDTMRVPSHRRWLSCTCVYVLQVPTTGFVMLIRLLEDVEKVYLVIYDAVICDAAITAVVTTLEGLY